MRYADIYQSLIQNGHSQTDLARYTRRQLDLFYQAIHRLQNQHQANIATAVNLGFSGGPSLEKYLKDLRGS